MEMTLRWYGSKFDTVKLEQIQAMKTEVEAAGLRVAGIESVNIHDAIKTGAADRDMYIDNYIATLTNLGKEDIHLACYNFMPVFDWTRTELARKRPDGSTVLAYTQEAVDAISPENSGLDAIKGDSVIVKDVFPLYLNML